ncbi:PHD-zinc-finger like domain-containing protein [Pisolithus tinctorius]|nr:PHD-zinc-finger like domain-containing protein [Pisolithus tinctorius]
MARGVKLPEQAKLPKVSFEIVQNDDSTQPAGVHDLQARSYGYNDFSEFQKPDHYIRYIEPLERDLATQVEYDMDEQDQEWLDAINVERKKDQLNLVTYETFEIIMDRLEKEYFDLTKNIPKPDYAMPSEDSTCAVCDDPEGENSNAIVFCDGCNLAVHQDCYGVPYIPEGQWLCRKCTVSPENPVSCIFCPNEGGAFKQTVLGDWAHLLCAIWIPETRVANEVFMEPISGSERIPKQRWKLKCSICGIREGACIQCTKSSCFLAFHATCARKEKLLMPMKSMQGSEPVTLTCYCEKHLSKEQVEARMKALAADGVMSSPNSKLSKSARAYAKTYKTGPPLVPQIIVDRILNYITKIVIRKKSEFVCMVCKYWSLKREARRGAPLLKRLHLEPWTASNVGKVQTEEEKALKLEHLRRVRKDLETLRELTLLSRKRESRKLAQLESIHRVLEVILFPHEAPMRLAFEKILALDRNGLFKHPVSKIEVPDYYDVVKNPMSWDIIDAKLDHHEYWDLGAFKNDVELVLSNATLYNKPGTPFYKTAQRMQTGIQPILADLSSTLHRDSVVDTTVPDPQTLDVPMGDLEPPLELLELLGSSEAIQNDYQFILKTDPLSSLFNFELGQLKPPPPPPPPKPKAPKKAAARVPKVREPNALDISPGFRAPRTRRAHAVLAAFEAEAAGSVVDAEIHDATVQKPVKGRRVPTAAQIPLVVPQVVEDVDNQGSFKMFDAGWILPSGQKRGGRQMLDRSSQPPPKKRARMDRGTSHVSTLSRTTSEHRVVQDIAPPEPIAGPSALPTEQMAETEPSVVEATAREAELTQEELEARIASIRVEPHTKVITERGRIVIEELDTPATRREKAQRRKAEKAAAILAAQQALNAPEPSHEDSDLSSLSELESEDGGDGDTKSTEQQSGPSQLPQPVQAVIPPTVPTRREPGTIILEDGKMLEGGTLVWAKASTYPWWPAVVYEPDDERIPKVVKKQRDTMRRTESGPLHLVQFFDKSSQWQWAELSKLLLLGENQELDSELLAPQSRRQRWKTSSIRKDCRDAYQRAIAEMETETDMGAEVEGGETEPIATDNPVPGPTVPEDSGEPIIQLPQPEPMNVEGTS